MCHGFSGGDRVFVLDSLVMQETVFQCKFVRSSTVNLFSSVQLYVL